MTRQASDAWGMLMGEADRLVEEQLEREARLPKPYYDEDGITIYCGDCRDILPHLPKVDLVLTDPPYGVGFTGKAGHYRNKPNAKRMDTYSSYEDTGENFREVILPILTSLVEKDGRAAVFMGSSRLQFLPPGEVGGIFLPNGCGRGRWGFQCFMHVVFYGHDPYIQRGMGSRPNGKYGVYGNDSNEIPHPCAKPLRAMLWAVDRCSLPGEVILDPFMGSGTTLVAAKQLGRRAIGIEIEEKYCQIAVDRLRQSVFQFDEPAPEPEQLGLLDA